MPVSISRLRKPIGAVAPVLKATPLGGAGIIGSMLNNAWNAPTSLPAKVNAAWNAPIAGGVAPVLKALPGSGGLGGIIQGLGAKPPIMKGVSGRVTSDLQRLTKTVNGR